MEIHCQSFWVQKAGCTEAEYEDACWPQNCVESSEPSFRCAIADGATDSSYSGMWARCLVQAFVDHRADSDQADSDAAAAAAIEQILTVSQPRWEQHVGQRELPWYAEQKAQAGAFSSLLGLTITIPAQPQAGLSECEWHALAIGDSCLVQVRGKQVIVKFPIERSSDFNSMPFLLASKSSYNSKIQEHLKFAHGKAQPQDTLYLMTDALACWFMAAVERGSGSEPWVALRNLLPEDPQAFAQMIEGLRARRYLKNDDCTLLRIDIVG